MTKKPEKEKKVRGRKKGQTAQYLKTYNKEEIHRTMLILPKFVHKKLLNYLKEQGLSKKYQSQTICKIIMEFFKNKK